MTIEDLLDNIEKEKDFVICEDGFWRYWPKDLGAISSWMLRVIADELDRRNEPWELQIDECYRKNDDEVEV